jgi:hypothetical protein
MELATCNSEIYIGTFVLDHRNNVATIIEMKWIYENEY